MTDIFAVMQQWLFLISKKQNNKVYVQELSFFANKASLSIIVLVPEYFIKSIEVRISFNLF